MSRWTSGSVRAGHVGVLFLVLGVAVGGLLVTASDPGSRQRSGADLSAAAVRLGGSLFVPGAAHVTGAADTNWRTDLEVFNPDPSAIAQYEISLLVKDAANTMPVTLPFQLLPGRSVRYDDVLFSMFGFTGSAALRITATAGSVVVSSRTYNLTDAGTYGQYIGGALEIMAIAHGAEARIIQLTQSASNETGYRTNIGFVNATATTIAVQLDLYRWDGAHLGTRNYSLDPFTFTQKDRVFRSVTQDEVTDGYAVVRTGTSGGAFFAYASVVDNRTGDPIYIPAVVVEGGAAPTPTPSATRTPTRTPTMTTTPPSTPTPTPTQTTAQLNLRPHQPDGWDAPLVVSGQAGTGTSGGLVGDQPTYVDWALLNEGPGDAVFPAGEGIVRLTYDGSTLVRWVSPDEDYLLEAGFYVYVEDYEVEGIPAGSHTLTMTGDPDGAIAETNEGDNSFSYTGQWSALKTAGEHGPDRTTVDIRRLRKAPISEIFKPANGRRSGAERAAKSRLAAGGSKSLATGFSMAVGEAVYIPATAHVGGAAGTNWRTDLELHNPGASQGQYEIALLLRDHPNPNPQTVVYTVASGRCLRLNDVLYTLFGFDGGASLRVTPLAGSLLVTSRTYNLTDQGTYGQFIGGIPESEAIGPGEDGVLIQLTHHRGSGIGFRTNVGFVSCVAVPIAVRADLYRADGSFVGTRSYALEPYMHRQVDRIFQTVLQADVADGYVVVTTTTPGGRFHAYASVVDNATGDPVYIPAVVVEGGGGPPQTPTPTPTIPPGVPADPRTSVTMIFEWLGTLGSSPELPTLEQAVAQYGTIGLESTLDLLVTMNPDVAQRIPNGVALDFGNGYTLDDGTVVSGQAEATFAELVHSSTRIEVDATASHQNLLIDGTYPLVDTISGSARLDVDGQGHVAGTYTFNGTGTTPMVTGDSSVTGDVEVDTEVCENYPIGGSVTVLRGDDEHVFSFTDSCDGTFGYLGPGSTGDVAFRLRWIGSQDLDIYVKEPSGETIYFGHTQSATGGQLDVDSNAGCTGPDPNPTENVFWPVGQAPHGSYEFWAQLWSACGGTETPDFTFFVLEGAEVVEEIHGTIADGTSPHYFHGY